MNTAFTIFLIIIMSSYLIYCIYWAYKQLSEKKSSRLNKSGMKEETKEIQYELLSFCLVTFMVIGMLLGIMGFLLLGTGFFLDTPKYTGYGIVAVFTSLMISLLSIKILTPKKEKENVEI